jgi:hypothetical protein
MTTIPQQRHARLVPPARSLFTSRRRRLLRDLRRNAEWARQARTTPTVESWTSDHANE